MSGRIGFLLWLAFARNPAPNRVVTMILAIVAFALSTVALAPIVEAIGV
jgi:hypothetical protein